MGWPRNKANPGIMWKTVRLHNKNRLSKGAHLRNISLPHITQQIFFTSVTSHFAQHGLYTSIYFLHLWCGLDGEATECRLCKHCGCMLNTDYIWLRKSSSSEKIDPPPLGDQKQAINFVWPKGQYSNVSSYINARTQSIQSLHYIVDSRDPSTSRCTMLLNLSQLARNWKYQNKRYY